MAESLKKKEGLQRIQIGLTGLVGVILLVGLANIAVQKVNGDGSAATSSASIANAELNANASGKPNEPLAELGVTPTADSAGQVVPDLQPDPNLRKRMDRDPAQR